MTLELSDPHHAAAAVDGGDAGVEGSFALWETMH